MSDSVHAMVGSPGDDAQDLRSAAEDLLQETRLLRAQFDELLEVLDQLGGEEQQTAPAAPSGIDDPVRLMAVDLKLAGHSREEVEQFLRQRFGIEPAPSLLDGVFRSVEQG